MATVEKVDPRQLHRLCYRSTQFRAADGSVTDGRTLEGYAAVFDTPTMIDSYEGEFEEVVKRGAFRRTLGQRTPVMQFDHGNDKRTGSVPIGSIEDIREDSQGLFVRARMFQNELVEPIRQAIADQAIRGMSFKFRVMDDRWVDSDGQRVSGDELADLMADPGERGPLRREITEVDLFELGPVVFPAYTETSVGVRSLPAGSPFSPNAVAVRGILGQFGLTERCVHRHLEAFDGDQRRVLASEIARTFPELVELLQRQDPPADPEPEPEAPADETSPEPAASAPRDIADPAPRRSAFLRESAGWHLPVHPYRR